jgi:hypothetical protein
MYMPFHLLAGMMAALPTACAAVAGALQQLPQQPPDTEWPANTDLGLRLLFTTELAFGLQQLFDSAYMCWLGVADLKGAYQDCFCRC